MPDLRICQFCKVQKSGPQRSLACRKNLAKLENWSLGHEAYTQNMQFLHRVQKSSPQRSLARGENLTFSKSVLRAWKPVLRICQFCRVQKSGPQRSLACRKNLKNLAKLEKWSLEHEAYTQNMPFSRNPVLSNIRPVSRISIFRGPVIRRKAHVFINNEFCISVFRRKTVVFGMKKKGSGRQNDLT